MEAFAWKRLHGAFAWKDKFSLVEAAKWVKWPCMQSCAWRHCMEAFAWKRLHGAFAWKDKFSLVEAAKWAKWPCLKAFA